MKLPEIKNHPEGLWNACDTMEMLVANELRTQLSDFEKPITDCYEAGVEAATIVGKRNHEEDMRIAAMFLKRTLTDLRSVWILLCSGYTSQAAAVCAALFEHALSVNCLAGHVENAKQLLKTSDGEATRRPPSLCYGATSATDFVTQFILGGGRRALNPHFTFSRLNVKCACHD
jgi:hypothetical protein